MSLSNRVLNVTLSMPSGPVVLDASLNMHVNAYKASLAIQNRATIEVFGLTETLREELLSQFTLYNRQNVLAGTATPVWVNVEIDAGYETTAMASPTGGQTAVSNTAS